MNINPFSIRDKEFPLSLRGYNKNEVENFLHRVADICKNLQNENKRLVQEKDKLQKELEGYRSGNKIDEEARNIREESERKATEILKEAEAKAEKMLEENKQKVKAIRGEIERLSKQKKLLFTELRSILNSHRELLKFYEEGNSSAGKSSATRSPLLYRVPSSKRKILFEEEK